MKTRRARPARKSLSLQKACRRRSPRPRQGGAFAGPGTQRGGKGVSSRRVARHAPPRQVMLPRERLVPLRQLERGLPRPPPLRPPSGQEVLLLRLVAPRVGRTSTSPRSAPTRRKKSKIHLCTCSSSILSFCLVSNLLRSEPIPFQDVGSKSGEESQSPGGYHRGRAHRDGRGCARDHFTGPGNYSAKQPPAQPPA